MWKLTILTSALSASEQQRYRTAFADFAATRGMQVHFTPGTTFIAPSQAPLTSDDRGAVLGWLCAQPEVQFIHVRRATPTSRFCSVVCTRRSEPQDQAESGRAAGACRHTPQAQPASSGSQDTAEASHGQ
ncbi:hypothetical protein [Inhella proteolytica]|uniref:Uncharacterized protein n=1 Tax=Inhella proteolytica TaxID=2795029 RepID=A0A931J4K2_9BURK|nr:hypothetical protein [Inhella proteolytica]MBH9578156.1 hypothetical protein [Inhella proteolytica]